jgi:hypothetical protein
MTTAPAQPATRVLVRTTTIDTTALALARRLEQASGCPVALVVDARFGAPEASDQSVLALSRAVCGGLGLYCPPDFAWKCGDYGYYVARRRFPHTQRFWMVETDVGFYGEASELFRFFARHEDVDFLAAQLRRADHSWFWTETARARDAAPFRCLFPLTRLTARAIDAALARRLAHGRWPQRRLVWPNDEALVATTLMNGDFVCRDFNDFGVSFYSEESFFFGHPLQGERLQVECAGARVVHPVLFGAAYADKVARLQQPEPAVSWLARRSRWAASKLNAYARW